MHHMRNLWAFSTTMVTNMEPKPKVQPSIAGDGQSCAPRLPLKSTLVFSEIALFRPMVYSPAFTFLSVYPLGVLQRAGLRLFMLRWFQAFWASSVCTASARSYLSCSAAPLSLRSAFRGLCRFSNQRAPFWPSGLTLQSSGLAFGKPLTLATRASPFVKPMSIHPAQRALVFS